MEVAQNIKRRVANKRAGEEGRFLREELLRREELPGGKLEPGIHALRAVPAGD
jgi:hypothetical protein